MRNIRTTFLASATAVAIAGVAGVAAAQSADTHVMTVRLPGGGIEEIRYTGNVPPRVVVATEPASFTAFDPISSFFGSDSSFARMERISAEMDREMAAMLAQSDNLATQARSGLPQMTDAALRSVLPPGSASYSFVSTLSENGICTKTVKITSQGNGAAPRVVSHSSGNCGPDASAPGAPVNLPAARSPVNKRPDMILTKANEAKPYTAMIRKVADAQR